ncbi:MAG: AhpC/TSA family protein [Pseudobdellovibrio sp.]
MPVIEKPIKTKPVVSILSFANCLVFDEHGNSTKLMNLWQNQTTIFIFLRHFGCLTCRSHAKQIWSERAKYEVNGSKIIFIGNGAANYIQHFKEDLGLQDATIYTDPSLKSFYAAGFKRGFIVALGPKALANGIKAYAAGSRQAYGKDTGNLWQLGGVLVIKPSGEVTYQYISQVTGDYAPEKDVTGAT